MLYYVNVPGLYLKFLFIFDNFYEDVSTALLYFKIRAWTRDVLYLNSYIRITNFETYVYNLFECFAVAKTVLGRGWDMVELSQTCFTSSCS